MSKVSLLQLMLFDFKLYIYSYLNAIRLFFLQFFFSPERVAIWKACWFDKAFSSKMQTQLFHLYACIWAIHCIWYSTILWINMCISLLSKRGKNSRFFLRILLILLFKNICDIICFVKLFEVFFSFTEWNFYKYIFFSKPLLCRIKHTCLPSSLFLKPCGGINRMVPIIRSTLRLAILPGYKALDSTVSLINHILHKRIESSRLEALL